MTRQAAGARGGGPRRHHTVPRFLLKAFVNERGNLWTWLVPQGRLVQLSPDDASVRSHFNTKEDGSVAMEEFLANEIESPFAQLLAHRLLSLSGAILGVKENASSAHSSLLSSSGSQAHGTRMCVARKPSFEPTSSLSTRNRESWRAVTTCRMARRNVASSKHEWQTW